MNQDWLKEIEERLERNTRPRPLSQESGYETAQHNRDISTILAAYKAAIKAIEEAPHVVTCPHYYFAPGRAVDACKCWKSQALNFNPTKQKEVI